MGHRAVGGVIHQPYYKNTENEISGRTFWGINEVGFGGFAPVTPPDGKRIITTTRYGLLGYKMVKVKIIINRQSQPFNIFTVHIQIAMFRQL